MRLKCFRIDSSARQGYIVYPWLFNVYMNAVMEVKMGMGRRRESGDYPASCMQMTWFRDESEEELSSMVGRFVGV